MRSKRQKQMNNSFDESTHDALSSEDESGMPSKSQRKRDVEALQKWGERLVELEPSALKQFNLPDDIYDAIIEAQRLTAHGAIRRQRQYIGRLMRDLDASVLERQWAAFQDGSQVRKRYDARIEHWRERLLNEPTGLAALLQEYPEADRDQFTKLIQQARTELAAQATTPLAFRQLYRSLKVLMPFSLDVTA